MLQRLANAHVAVLGLGGVGTWVVEALARTGVGTLTLVDLDEVCVTNTNRQLHALDGQYGRSKVDATTERVAAIHPGCTVRPEDRFFTEATADDIFRNAGFDVVVDAIDRVGVKCLAILKSREHGNEIVTVGGAGGRRDPTQVRADDLTRSHHDPLLQQVRKRLRQRHGFPRNRRKRWGVGCVYSPEPPVFPTPEGGVCEQRPGDAVLRLDCESGYGAASAVTGTFGLFAAHLALGRILKR